MERIDKILKNKKFIKCLKKNNSYEKKRKFCRHGFEHYIDVARIAYIYNLENGLGFSKDVIYAAALLHDVGKWKQYKDKTPHNVASAELSEGILKKAGYDKKETEQIISAIFTHRNYNGDKNTLNYAVFFADKKARLCFMCKAEKECDWEKSKKTMKLTV